eukprot:GFUD01007819.1.p1 GENE.GFUD01007819.1~~GFUD01007819.1.p1  ORF type:complete len:462 (+),score=70.07 GFUD01007819.1:51-1436(+)
MPPNCNCNCGGCKLCGDFLCSEFAPINDIVTILGISLLPFQAEHTDNPAEIDKEMENLYTDWRCQTNNGIIEMTPPKKTGSQSSLEEEKVLQLFRTNLDLENLENVAIFPNFKPGPLINRTAFGVNLDNILQTPERKETLFRAFNLNVDEVTGSDWRKQINKNRQEKDLVIIFGCFSFVLQVETKGGIRQGNVEQQFRTFKAYLERTHGTLLKNLKFLPVLAKHPETQVGQWCTDYLLDISSSVSQFSQWWENFLPIEVQAEASTESFEKLVKRMLMISSLVLTSLPQQLSQNSPDSHLIILRKGQWRLLSAPPQFAVIQGNPTTGKSLALELGLAFRCTEESCGSLVSLGEYSSFQNEIRSDHFMSTDITFICYQNATQTPTDLLQIMKTKQETQSKDSIICFDDFPLEDLKNPDVRNQIRNLMEKSRNLWIVVDDSPSSFDLEDWKEDWKALGFTFLQF